MKSLTLLGVFVVALGCSSGEADAPFDAAPDTSVAEDTTAPDDLFPDGSPGDLDATDLTHSVSATIGPGGGSVELYGQSSSGILRRAVLAIPESALTQPVGFRLSWIDDASVPESLHATTCGPFLLIEPAGTEFERPAWLTISLTESATQGGEWPVVLSSSDGGTSFEPLPTAYVDDGRAAITTQVAHLSLFVPAVILSPSPLSTSFEPAKHGFIFANYGHPAACSGGSCIAFTGYAAWFFDKHPERELFGRYCLKCFDPNGQPATPKADVLASCEQGFGLTCNLFTGFYAGWNGILTNLDSLTQIANLDWQQYWSVRTALWATKKPQLLAISGKGSDGKISRHSVLAIGYTANSLKIYDPNYPGRTEDLSLGLLNMDKYKNTYTKIYHVSTTSVFNEIEAQRLYDTFLADMCPVETCDGCDNNCDGRTDEAFPGLGNTCVSGLGVCAESGAYECSSSGDELACSAEAQAASDETCNALDDNCDGRTDEEDALGCTPYYVDGDNDGFGAGDARCLCAPEAPYVIEDAGDCRDDKAKVHPGADELCDGLDNDCNSQTDEGGVCVEPCVDNDNDGFGVGPGCTGQPDCDDTKAKVYPNAPEKCDGLDNDCDTQTDEDDVCGEPPFENPDDTETEDVQVTVTQVETTPGSKQIKLFAKVETQQGKPLQQLTIGNFVLRETIGGATQTLPLDSLFATKETGEGMSAGLLIDSSGSMGSGEGSPLAQAKVAAKLFVSKLKPQDAAAVVDFGSDVHVNADFTNDKQTLFGAIDACSDGGMTSMYDALSTGIGMIAGRAGQRALVLLSDGGDNDSACSPCAPNDAVGPAVAAGVPIFTIGLGASPGSGLESDLIAISNGTFAGQNGSAYYATVDPLGLQAIYDAIATVLKNMYVIGWYTQGDSGETVDVTITVTYTCASGTFTDTFVTSYVVP